MRLHRVSAVLLLVVLLLAAFGSVASADTGGAVLAVGPLAGGMAPIGATTQVSTTSGLVTEMSTVLTAVLPDWSFYAGAVISVGFGLWIYRRFVRVAR